MEGVREMEGVRYMEEGCSGFLEGMFLVFKINLLFLFLITSLQFPMVTRNTTWWAGQH